MKLPWTSARRFEWRTSSSVAAMWVLIGASSPLLFGTPSLASAACTPPPELTTRLKAQPTSENYATLGNWFVNTRQFDCAATAFASASRLQPKSATLAYLWGLSLYSSGHNEQAVAPLIQAKLLDANDIRPHLALAAVLDRQRRVADAENEWRAALAIDPDSAPALDSLSQDLIDQKDYPAVIALLDKPGTSRARTPQQSLNLGEAYVGTAQLEPAIKTLREGLNDDADSLPIADELSLVLMLHGRDQDAFAVLDLALDKHPNDKATQLIYLRALVSAHGANATELGRKLLKAYPNEWEVLYLNAILESREADFASARAHLERSVALKPDYFQSHWELGNTLAKLGDLPGARQQFEQAIALGDNDPEVEYDLAMVLKRLGDTAQAQEKLRIYQQLKEARSNRIQAAGKAEEGDQAMAAGDSVQAASLYRQALEDDPDEPILSYKLSRALDKLNDISGETQLLQRAIQLNPNLAEAQNQLGYLRVRDGDPEQAEGFFRAAVRASPSYVAAWINLAATLASESKWQDAKEAVKQALAVDPNSTQARQLSQALADPHSAP